LSSPYLEEEASSGGTAGVQAEEERRRRPRRQLGLLAVYLIVSGASMIQSLHVPNRVVQRRKADGREYAPPLVAPDAVVKPRYARWARVDDTVLCPTGVDGKERALEFCERRPRALSADLTVVDIVKSRQRGVLMEKYEISYNKQVNG
jgi:hypothetical protein